jgi:hypothetical protein
MTDKKELILCAAIWYNDGKARPHLPKNIESGVVACGYRHPNCFVTLSVLYKEEDKSGELTEEAMRTSVLRNSKQGFLTNENRFVERREALKIAVLSGQIKEAKYGDQLYSEDLY